MKIKVSCFNNKRNDEDIGICVMEGRVKEHFSGNVLSDSHRTFRGREDIALAVIGRTDCGIPGSKMLLKNFLKRFEQWFSKDLPTILHHFSFEIVKCYWQDLIFECLGGWQEKKEPLVEFAVFLLYDGKYLFCGAGDIVVYEYLFPNRKYKRWYTCRERHMFNWELGETEQKISFKIRAISEQCLFILCPETFIPESPGKLKRKKKWNQFVGKLAERIPGAIVIWCQDISANGRRRR